METEDVDDLHEHGTEQQQPDHGLHQVHGDPPRLAHERAQVPDHHVVGIEDSGHRAVSFPTSAASASAVSNVRPVWRRYTSSSDGRATVTDATGTPLASSACST